jgi:hypothetical protein
MEGRIFPVSAMPEKSASKQGNLDFMDVWYPIQVSSKINLKGKSAMAKDPPYHTSSPEYPLEHRNVYHDHNDCPDGKHIKPEHRLRGNGAKPLCKTCAKMG